MVREKKAALHQRVLMLCNLPPPVHGQAVVNQQVAIFFARQTDVKLTVQSIGRARSFQDLQRRKVIKLLSLVRVLLKCFLIRVRKGRWGIVYLAFAPFWPVCLRDALAVWVAKSLGRRVILHVHGEGFEAFLKPARTRDRLVRWLIKGAEVIVLTEKSKMLCEHSGLFPAVWHVPNAVKDLGGANKNHDHGGRLRLLTLANLDPRKGTLLALDVVQALQKREIDLSLDLVGNETQWLSFEELSRQISTRGIRGLCTVHGPLYAEDKEAILKGADVFLYPSRHDHAPLVLLEALSMGLVPVTFATGDIASMLGLKWVDHALDPAEEDSVLVEKMADLIEKYAQRSGEAGANLLETAAAAAYSCYKKDFTPEVFEGHLREVWQGAIASNRTSNRK